MDKAGYHHKNLKDALIEKGLELFDEVGYDKFSLRKVAKACGVSEAAPYRHFENKDSLLIAIISQAYEKFDEVLKEAVSRYPDDPGSQLREMAYLYVKFFVENPEYMKFLFFSDASKQIEMTKESFKLSGSMVKPYQTFIRAIEEYKKQADERNTQKKVDINAMILACWGLAHGIAVLITQNDFEFDGDCLELAKDIIWSDLFIK